MGHSEDILNPVYQLVKRVCGWTLIFLYFPPWIWLTLSRVDQSSISCSIEEFYIAGLQSANFSNFNQSIIYFKLYLGNNEDNMAVYYENLNLTFSYYASTGIVPVGNYTIPGFHQGIKKNTDRNAYVVTTPGYSWQEISKKVSSPSGVVFRVDLGSAVKFREFFSKAKSKTRKIMAWADVEVDRISCKKTSKKGIKLKHMIKHHVNGWVTFVFIFMIVAELNGGVACILSLRRQRFFFQYYSRARESGCCRAGSLVESLVS
ncbi:hypothetical protein POM88_040128 [Heracleum sosnowskyi]|uniref:Uncharacterized protein n=1 Tax=Heracleum sosnowskyi TaxID=360622 RepID=A0AAD8HBE4_9APIA|nr:hypothetical protein POM88_040128 [Heracleum sosnowskyi]